jgi:eukaryotic-like serine/threonine-protein kinase
MHGAGLIYRDMKPSNVMIDRDKQVKVVDFGIAKLLEPGQRNTMVGTPGYSPPEQYQGLATVQSDVYALGATLHHLLTGRDPREHPPFSFPFAQTLNRGVSMRTAKAIDKALQMEVADRFHTVEEFRRALPIPTGERQRTRTFDPRDVEEPRTPSQPARPEPQPQRSRTAPQPRPSTAPRSAPATQPAVATPPAKPPRRRRGRAIRNVVVATLLTAGLAGAGTVLVPEVLPAIREFITQPAPAPADPSGSVLVPRAFRVTVSVELPDGTLDADVRTALREAYLAQARAQYPGAELSANQPLATEGSITASDPVEGKVTYTATLRGYLSVPQTP